MSYARLTAGLLTVLLLAAYTPASQSRTTPSSEDTFPLGRGYPTLAPLLRRITPAVVDISVESKTGYEQRPFFRDLKFRRFLEQLDLPFPDLPGAGRQYNVGSRFIVDAMHGYGLTNRHVIEKARSIKIILKDGRSHRARLIGSESRADIAMLQMVPTPSGLEALRFGDSDRLEVGDFVLAVGNPFGIGQTVTSGIVSALGHHKGGDRGIGDFIQTDASINLGSSGGPLVDMEGRVVGINTALIGPGGSNVGIGFATPVNRARTAMDRS